MKIKALRIFAGLAGLLLVPMLFIMVMTWVGTKTFSSSYAPVSQIFGEPGPLLVAGKAYELKGGYLGRFQEKDGNTRMSILKATLPDSSSHSQSQENLFALLRRAYFGDQTTGLSPVTAAYAISQFDIRRAEPLHKLAIETPKGPIETQFFRNERQVNFAAARLRSFDYELLILASSDGELNKLPELFSSVPLIMDTLELLKPNERAEF